MIYTLSNWNESSVFEGFRSRESSIDQNPINKWFEHILSQDDMLICVGDILNFAVTTFNLYILYQVHVYSCPYRVLEKWA